MTTYNLPEGMTAEKLRELADFMRLHGLFVNGGMVHAWADAIDPPKPPSVVTDEIVEAVHTNIDLQLRGATFHTAATLEAAVECGWTPPQDTAEKLAERLAMAEGLLRAATYLGAYRPEKAVNGLYWEWCIGRAWAKTYVGVSEAEAKYLRSLDGEGDSDE